MGGPGTALTPITLLGAVKSLIVCTVDPLLFSHPPVPAKLAVIVWLPALKFDVLKLAWPVPSTATDPSVVAPSLNVTVPTGVPAPVSAAVTVAVKTTVCW